MPLGGSPQKAGPSGDRSEDYKRITGPTAQGADLGILRGGLSLSVSGGFMLCRHLSPYSGREHTVPGSRPITY